MFYPGTQSGIPLGNILSRKNRLHIEVHCSNQYINNSLKLLKARVPFFAHSATKNVFGGAQSEVRQFLELESLERLME